MKRISSIKGGSLELKSNGEQRVQDNAKKSNSEQRTAVKEGEVSEKTNNKTVVKTATFRALNYQY